MSANYIWPASLPEYPQKGYSETKGAQILRTAMDSGIAKQRRRNYRPDTLSVSYLLSKTQVTALDTWIEDTIRGVSRFYWMHPRTQTQVEARIVPQQDGQLYTIAHVTETYFTVNLTLEILP